MFRRIIGNKLLEVGEAELVGPAGTFWIVTTGDSLQILHVANGPPSGSTYGVTWGDGTTDSIGDDGDISVNFGSAAERVSYYDAADLPWNDATGFVPDYTGTVSRFGGLGNAVGTQDWSFGSIVFDLYTGETLTESVVWGTTDNNPYVALGITQTTSLVSIDWPGDYCHLSNFYVFDVANALETVTVQTRAGSLFGCANLTSLTHLEHPLENLGMSVFDGSLTATQVDDLFIEWATWSNLAAFAVVEISGGNAAPTAASAAARTYLALQGWSITTN